MKLHGFQRKLVVSLLIGAVALPCIIWGSMLFLTILTIVFGCIMLGELLYFTVRRARSLKSWTLSMCMVGMITWGVYGVIMTVQQPLYNWLLLTVAATIATTDGTAQVFGMKFGTPGTFASKLSPNKTQTGVVAGVLFGTALALIGLVIWALYGVTFPARVAGVLIMAPMYSVAGDLIESAVKRSLGIKDFGRLLGRETGGLLDRLDSWLPTFGMLGLALYLWSVSAPLL